jgi:nucleotide-binding universal stress UspA family protein
VLHVLEPVSYPTELLGEGLLNEPTRRDLALEQIRGAVGRTFGDLQPEILTVEGDPSRAITKTAEEMHADILIMATRGKGAFRRFLLGSVTAKVLNDTAIPMLTTTHSDNGSRSCSPEGVTKVLCGVALDDRAESVCRAAALVAAEYGASLTLVHVLEGAATSDAHRENALSRLQKMATACGGSATFCVEAGSPDNVIGSIARATATDLVVIGRSSPGPLGRLRAQSYGIIRESPCPVLSI